MKQSFGLEFDAFEEAMRGVEGRYTPVRRHKFDWQMQHLVLGDIELMLGQNGGASIYEGSCLAQNFGVFFTLGEIEALMVDGCHVEKNSLTWLASGKAFHIYNSDAYRWVGISVGHGTVNQWLDLEVDHFCVSPIDHIIGKASRAHLVALRDLVIRLFGVHELSPEALASPYAANQSHDQLAWAVYDAVRSVESSPPRTAGRPRVSRGKVIQEATALIDTHIFGPVRVADLCRVSCVSERTLHKIFVEHFGIGPRRYLTLRRLKAIHRSLALAEPSDSISRICRQFGVWDFGRFAALYRRFYGVVPSQTLAKARPTLPGSRQA